MKIFGDIDSSEFKNYTREPGIFFGDNKFLKGTRKTTHFYSSSMSGVRNDSKTVEPRLHLHIPKNAWTTFTGKLREYCLPWRWKAAYLDPENGTPPCRILVCTSVQEGELSDRLRELMGQSWFVTNLIHRNGYNEIFGQEFLCLHGQNHRRKTKILHPLGKMIGVYREGSNDLLCHIYRSRSLFSIFKYHLLKQFSNSWKEVVIQTAQVSEKILIKKSDEEMIVRVGLIT